MIRIRVDKGDRLEKALRQFKRICNDAGLFREIKRLSFYEKPSERRRREEQQREKNIRNLQKKKKKRIPRFTR
ncbi:MAG: 30S ribosomal protein S21 [Planctomycetes bacterium]|nr:30S ribosomal protein S21 [Planctomycetota bacterium]